MEDIIVAVSTLVGNSAINIVRLSGKGCINLVNNFYTGKNLLKVKSNTINYGFITNNGDKIDEVLVSVFKSPKTYTKEDIVEINCHGGVVSTNKILEICLQNGARLAEPGEFLKRAFLNGRIDLIEAESVSDLINSKTENARKLSMNGINGKLSNNIQKIRHKIIEMIANIRVNIDYPEYDEAEVVTHKLLKKDCKSLFKDIEFLRKTSNSGLIIKNGLKIAIIGSPNVGKSSILNKLLSEDKSIVTDIEGTTRDVVEGTTIIDGINVTFSDTAGIHESDNLVEQLGIKKTYEVIKDSNIILMVLDASRSISKEEKEIIKELDHKKTLIVVNKIDLPKKINMNLIKGFDKIEISTINDTYTLIEEYVSKKYKIENDLENDFTFLSNARHIKLINESYDTIKELLEEIENKKEVDLLEITLSEILEKLSEITGDSYKQEILDEIFSNFCLGK